MNMVSLFLEKSNTELGEMIQSDFREYARLTVEKTLNELLQGELEAFLEDALSKGEADSKNGGYGRVIMSGLGALDIRMPRDRACLFRSSILGKYQRSLDDVDSACVDLYAKGMTLGQIVDYLSESLGESVSKETVRKKVRASLAEADSFNTRELPRCVFVFLDGTYVPIKRGYAGGPKSVEKECVEVALGITEEGKPVVLGYYFIPSEGAVSWEENLRDLKKRGIGDPRLFITDGLNGLGEAIKKVFPSSPHQNCIVHVCRNVMRHARKCDRAEIAADFMSVFRNSSNKEEAEAALKLFASKWGRAYPKCMASLLQKEGLFEYMATPRCLWKGLYTSNRIEGFNAKLKRATRQRILLNSEGNATIVITNCCRSYNKSAGSRSINNYDKLTPEEKAWLGFAR